MTPSAALRFKPATAAPAVLSRPSGPNRNGPLCSARVAQILAPGHSLKLTFLDQLLAEQKQFEASRAQSAGQFAALSELVAKIQDRATGEEWSQREVCARLGITRTSWQRLCAGQVNPAEWLPRLRDAATRLHLT